MISWGSSFRPENNYLFCVATILLTVFSVVSTSCQSACQDEFTCPYIEPCPNSPGLYYKLNSGLYFSSNASITQDTCNSGIKANSINGIGVNITLGSDMVSVVSVSGSSFGNGMIRCNQAVLMSKPEQIMNGACVFNISRSSTIKLINDNKLTIAVTENRAPADPNCTMVPSNCVLSYAMTLTM